MYSYPQGQRSSRFQKMKGVFLACTSVARSVLGEQPEIFAFQVSNVRGLQAHEAMINTVKVLPVIRVDDERDPGF